MADLTSGYQYNFAISQQQPPEVFTPEACSSYSQFLPLLTVSDLSVTFRSGVDRIRAVDGVSFELGQGEKLGVVGESGSGKSALHLALLGLLPQPPQCQIAGRARFDEQDLLGAHDKAMRTIRGGKIALVFQNPLSALHPFLTIGEQIQEPLIHHRRMSRRAAKPEAIRLLERVGIPEPAVRARQYPHQFSGGMRQRAMIAMAMAGNPKLIIADEPTTALDATVRRQILRTFADVCDETGAALILITHDLTAAAEICRSVHVMYAGRIVEAGSIADVFQQPRHPYTKALLETALVSKHGSRSVEPGAPLPTIPGQPPDLRRLPTGCAFHPRCAFKEEVCERDRPPLEASSTRVSPTHNVSKPQESQLAAPVRQRACHVEFDA